jgi:putative copper export protein
MLLRVLHLLSAMVLVGGLVFMFFVVGYGHQDEGSEAFQKLRRRWSLSVMIASAVLLVTGLINAVRIVTAFQFPSVAYHSWLGIKILLALAVMFGASILSGRSAQAQRCRQMAVCGYAILCLALATLIVAVYLKEADRVPKTESASVPAPAVSR